MTDLLDLVMTPRQLELLSLVASGYEYTQIGEMKHLSPHTVRNALYAARDRVAARNVTHLAVLCVERGLIIRQGVMFVPAVVDERIAS
jgi:DNA-binding CsgD family transcriptional regulator